MNISWGVLYLIKAVETNEGISDPLDSPRVREVLLDDTRCRHHLLDLLHTHQEVLDVRTFDGTRALHKKSEGPVLYDQSTTKSV